MSENKYVKYVQNHEVGNITAQGDAIGGEPLPYTELPETQNLLRQFAQREAQVRAEEQEKARGLVEALEEEYREKLYFLYNHGVTQNGKWCHKFEADGEELVHILGLDVAKGWYDAEDIQQRIANAVHPAFATYSDNRKG